MNDGMTRIAGAVLLATGALLGSACTSPSRHDDHPAAETVAMTNQWAGAADVGMTAVFGTFTNSGHHDAHVVGGSSPLAGSVEVHDVVPDATGAMTMRPKDGGLTVPAGETRELIPGGDHLMLMDLKQPLRPGADVPLTVVFDDGSAMAVTAQVRDFAGASESYVPADGTGGTPHHHG